MATKRTPVHSIECRSVLTAEQAFSCPLCRLRAAAPDLLEAAKAVLAYLEDRTEYEHRPIAAGNQKVLRAAIARAEGK